MGKHDDALADYDKVLCCDHSTRRSQSARHCAGGARTADEALAAYDAALAIDPDDAEGSTIAVSLLRNSVAAKMHSKR